MPRRGLRFLALVLPLCLVGPAAAQPAPKRTHDITVADYFTQADLFAVALSPDGNFIAYTEGRWQQSTDDRKADLWVVDARSSINKRLTSDRASYRAPQWGADNRAVFVLANRKRDGAKAAPFDGKAQVWRVGLDGGEPTALTQIEGGVSAFEIAQDGKSLVYQTQTESVGDDFQALRQKFKQVEYGHGVNQFSQVWKLDLQSWRSEKIIDAGRVIRDLALSPDGQRIAMITTPDDKVVSFEGQSRVDIYDARTGKISTVPDKIFRKDAPSPYGWLEHLAWSPDSNAVAFNVIFDGYPAEVIAADVQEKTVKRMPRPAGVHVKGYGSPIHWLDNSQLAYLGEEKGRVRLHTAALYIPNADGNHKQLTGGDVVVENFHVGRGGKHFALVIAAPTQFADVYHLELGKNLKRVTKVNPQADAWKLPQLSVVSWKAPDGSPVEGVLELPPDYKKGDAPLPLVVEIHGGPTTSATFKLQYWIYGRTLLPARGYALLTPNYRGSTGYGDKFVTDLIGRENDLDVKDILAGVDALVERGVADPKRLAVSGWSNGGYLTNCIITQTTRFKAAISGAGIVDAVMEFGSNDEPAYSMVFKKGFPWSSAAQYHKASPTYQLDKIRTPTLIHVGANDERCPPGHSRMLYRTLKEYSRVPTELLVYPGESHGLMKYRSRQAKLEWDLAWLDRYVLGKK